MSFSTFVIKALVDTITGGTPNDETPPIGIYRSGRKIELLFLDCGLDMDIGAGSRVPATIDFLRQVAQDYEADEKLARLLVRVADPRDYLATPEKGQAVQIRNKNTRRAYAHATWDFLAWCESARVASIADVQPLHVAAYIEQLGRERSAPTVKQHLAAIRHLFDWLVTGQVIPANPASSVRGPSHSVKRGKTPVLDPAEARALLDSIDVTKPVGLRDRALIGLMVYSFARIGAALSMKVEDIYVQNRRLWVRLHEKGGKRHEMPCHHNLETYLHAYIVGCGLESDPKGPLFRTIGRGTNTLTTTPLPQANAYAMIRRRAGGADIATKIGNHTFRATGITAYLKNGGTLEKAAIMANHASTRTTQLYDRRRDDVSLDEVERILV